MAHKIQNLTTQQRTLLLLDRNAITLMPRGSSDAQGPTDCATLLEGEEQCSDVRTQERLGHVALTRIESITKATPKFATNLSDKTDFEKGNNKS